MILALHAAVTHPNIWDYFRFGIAFGDIFIMLISIFVVSRYFVAYRVARIRSSVAALLPGHVWMIATSYLLFIFPGSFFDAYTRLGEGPSARLFLYLFATAMGLLALAKLVGYEGRKYRKSTNYIFRPDFDK